MGRATTPASAATARVSPLSGRSRTFSTYSYVSSHATEQDALVALQLVDAFTYVLKYNTGRYGNAKIYRCADHVDCGHLLRVKARECDTSGETEYIIERAGAHTAELSGYTRSGIHPAFLQDIDAATVGPTKILKTLTRKYQGNETMLAVLPTMTQIKNRRALKKKKPDEQVIPDDDDRAELFPLPTLAHLYEWAGSLYCTTADKFFPEHYYRMRFDRTTDEAAFARLDKARQHGTIVLKAFRHNVEIEGESEPQQSIGIVLTSRRLFRNLLYAVDCQQEGGVVAVIERTCVLEEGGWVLVALGSYRATSVPDIRGPSKVFVPWAYFIVVNEHQIAYDELFRTVIESAKTFFDVDLNIRLASLDGEVSCIGDALKTQWPQITLVASFAHAASRCGEQIPLTRNPFYLLRNIEGHIQQLFHARSSEQFVALATVYVASWRAHGEAAFADWFMKNYVQEQAVQWHATSGIPGCLPLDRVALKQHNDVIKTCGLEATSSKLDFVLQTVVPKILTTMGAKAPTQPFGKQFREGPIPSGMLRQAKAHIGEGAHYVEYHRVDRKRVPRSLVFNSGTGADEQLDVTVERVNIYLDSKGGELAEATEGDGGLERQYLSLHEVEVIGTPEQMKAFKLELAPVMSADRIREIQSLYRCDCDSFWRTGWMCDHVVAAAALMDQFDLDANLRAMGSEHSEQ